MSSLDQMRQRLIIAGGDQDGRNVKAKLKSLQSALRNSYQAEWIHYNGGRWRCLLNPDKETTEYDQKTISIEFDADMQPGGVFYWDRVKSHWIVFNAKEEEEAYFRASARRCDYTIDVPTEDGVITPYWVYVRGITETDLIWNQKSSVMRNQMNYNLKMYITKDEYTNAFFTRHKKLKFEGHNWRVATVDRYGQKGIIELHLEEDFDNEMEDVMITPEIVVPDTRKPYIEGPQFIYPYSKEISYTIVNASGGEFVVDSSKVEIAEVNENSILLNVLTGKSTKFNIYYKNSADDEENIAALLVHVKSL